MYHNTGDVSNRTGYDLEQVLAIAKVTVRAVFHSHLSALKSVRDRWPRYSRRRVSTSRRLKNNSPRSLYYITYRIMYICGTSSRATGLQQGARVADNREEVEDKHCCSTTLLQVCRIKLRVLYTEVRRARGDGKKTASKTGMDLVQLTLKRGYIS